MCKFVVYVSPSLAISLIFSLSLHLFVCLSFCYSASEELDSQTTTLLSVNGLLTSLHRSRKSSTSGDWRRKIWKLAAGNTTTSGCRWDRLDHRRKIQRPITKRLVIDASNGERCHCCKWSKSWWRGLIYRVSWPEKCVFLSLPSWQLFKYDIIKYQVLSYFNKSDPLKLKDYCFKYKLSNLTT